jgi:hypothetical protein
MVSVDERFFARVHYGPVADVVPRLGRCWMWTGRIGPDGYPRFDRGGTTTTGMRAGWEVMLEQEMPLGFGVRHFACTRQVCVNPEHSRPWTASEDLEHDRVLLFWNARHDECVKGHRFSKANTINVPGGRSCRTCRKDVERQRDRRRRAKSPT